MTSRRFYMYYHTLFQKKEQFILSVSVKNAGKIKFFTYKANCTITGKRCFITLFQAVANQSVLLLTQGAHHSFSRRVWNQKPRLADNGLGWRCYDDMATLIDHFDFFLCRFPHKINTIGFSRSFNFSMIVSVNLSQPFPR